MTIEVRRATPRDVPELREVAVDAWRDTYAGSLRPETIEGFLARSYSLERLDRRIGADIFLVAVSASDDADDGPILAFANARREEGRLDLLAIYARPEFRGQGAGTALLTALRAEAAGLPVTADVLAGNRKGETFYEARGFAPRERLEVDMFDERVVLRRWWLDPEDAAAGGPIRGADATPSETSGS